LDIQERRKEAELEAKADYVFDPTLVETPDGKRLPWEMVKLMRLPNIFEPIVAEHKNIKSVSSIFMVPTPHTPTPHTPTRHNPA
jgi:hypothetical protein